MRLLESDFSSFQVITASLIFLMGDFVGVRKRFLASCWLIVDPPDLNLPAFRSFSIAFCMASRSKPSCCQNLSSSAIMAALAMYGEIREYGTQTWLTLRFFFLVAHSASLYSIMALFFGFSFAR